MLCRSGTDCAINNRLSEKKEPHRDEKGSVDRSKLSTTAARAKDQVPDIKY